MAKYTKEFKEVASLFGKLSKIFLELSEKEEESKGSIEQAAKVIKDTHEEIQQILKSSKEEAIEGEVIVLLRELGVPADIKGYVCLVKAITLIVKDRNKIDSITKTLYPEVAESLNTTPSRVERAIRHAIEVVWSRGNVEKIDELFKFTVSCQKGKATNGEFIALISDEVRRKI